MKISLSKSSLRLRFFRRYFVVAQVNVDAMKVMREGHEVNEFKNVLRHLSYHFIRRTPNKWVLHVNWNHPRSDNISFSLRFQHFYDANKGLNGEKIFKIAISARFQHLVRKTRAKYAQNPENWAILSSRRKIDSSPNVPISH